MSKFPTKLEEDKEVIKTNKKIDFNTKNCLLLVISEKTVLNFYIKFCEYCLSLGNDTDHKCTSCDNINKFRELKCIRHHGTSRLAHINRVAKLSFYISKKLNLTKEIL